MSARNDYPPFVGAHRHGETGRYEAMCDEIDRLRAALHALRDTQHFDMLTDGILRDEDTA